VIEDTEPLDHICSLSYLWPMENKHINHAVMVTRAHRRTVIGRLSYFVLGEPVRGKKCRNAQVE
jgi:hypothetical protein